MEIEILREQNIQRMQPLGEHIIVEAFVEDAELLNNEKFILESLVKAAEEAKATVLGKASHKFKPQGVTAFVLLAESHISVHTWPEHGYAALDIFTCGVDPIPALEYLKREWKISRMNVVKMDRGLLI